MLPTEAFTEAVALLRLVDLGALAVTNAMCSSLALQASTSIRREEFPGLHFCIANRAFTVFRRVDAPNDESGRFDWQYVDMPTFPSENAMIEFVTAAFPNCIFDDLGISSSVNTRLLDAIGQVADAVIIEGVLSLSDRLNPDDTLNLARKFRKVKALRLERAVRDDEADEIANFCRGSGIQELWYRSYGESTLRKLVLM